MPLLFSYGTLQQEGVQLATFGRLLSGARDRLTGYRLSSISIEDPGVVAASGKACHPIITFTGTGASQVEGTVFEITEAELNQADGYEVAAYKRVSAVTDSGKTVWVYVSAASA